MTLASDLRAAKALIDTPEKWAHKEADRKFNRGRCLCAYDALVASCGSTAWTSAVGRLERAVSKALPAYFVPKHDHPLVPIAQFNDDPGTTHADIMALFQRAIEAAERDEVQK